ncbi:MAG: DUF488 family protein [Chloroflexota bacterium]|nr:DUF488 family protein [Chloroflexota bacterium]MDE3101429.1 DUF488 family protein [Chloroflexota bacterium]
MATVRIRHAYEARTRGDGHCVLVDRLWPRGLSKERASWDEWRKDLAPSTELRRWYGHDPEKFAEFRRRYASELRTPSARAALRELASRRGAVTLVTATHDIDHSGAAVLARVLDRA